MINKKNHELDFLKYETADELCRATGLTAGQALQKVENELRRLKQ